MFPPIKVNFAGNLPANLPRPLRLSIELIPMTTVGINLRSKLTPAQWNVLRHAVYARAGYCCEACDASNIEVHCHEVWDWDDKKHIQKLIGLRCLCWECHKTTHLSHRGFTRDKDIVKRLVRINGIRPPKAYGMLLKARIQCSIRSKHEWILDTSWLNEYLQREKSEHG